MHGTVEEQIIKSQSRQQIEEAHIIADQELQPMEDDEGGINRNENDELDAFVGPQGAADVSYADAPLNAREVLTIPQLYELLRTSAPGDISQIARDRRGREPAAAGEYASDDDSQYDSESDDE